jgi:hypothetical protein
MEDIMSSRDQNPNPAAETKKQKRETLAFEAPFSFELMFWPYRTFSRALLRSHDGFSTYLEANRKLADEMREIIRREQDLILEISEKVLQRMSATPASGENPAIIPSAEIDEIYDSALTGMRELGKAFAEAQVRSLETLRSQTRAAMGGKETSETRVSAAA